MNQLDAISLSHKNADLLLRQKVSIFIHEQEPFINFLKKRFKLKGLLLFNTCNRFEIYYEGEKINPYDLISALCKYKNLDTETKFIVRFEVIGAFNQVVNHLASVALGLRSSVWGDKEVIGQLKKAYQITLSYHLQGSILERAIQTVFKIHKKVVNSTDLKRRSESWSYLSLKKIKEHLNPVDTNILLIGAGKIIQDLVKYMPKFNFKSVTIVNRTDEKAKGIADQHQLNCINWKDLNPEFISQFGAVIFAISIPKTIVNYSDLPSSFQKPKVWIDLGLPHNADPDIQRHPSIKLYNLDYFSGTINKYHHLKKQQEYAIEEIKNKEINHLNNWFNRYTLMKKPDRTMKNKWMYETC